MNKIFLLSDSDDQNARDVGVPSHWYTVIHDDARDEVLAKQNPWNQDESEYEKRCYLMDDCVISIRPARYEDRISRVQDYNKDCYFVEISNQDRSSISTSNKVYSWDEAVKLGSYFKGLTFTAATRVWKVKKL